MESKFGNMLVCHSLDAVFLQRHPRGNFGSLFISDDDLNEGDWDPEDFPMQWAARRLLRPHVTHTSDMDVEDWSDRKYRFPGCPNLTTIIDHYLYYGTRCRGLSLAR